MREEDRYDRHEGDHDRDGDHDRGNGGRGDNGITRGELARFNQFLDNPEYEKNHPDSAIYGAGSLV